MNKKFLVGTTAFALIALTIFSSFTIAQPPGKSKGLNAFSADLSASTVAEGFIVSKGNSWYTKDRVYTGSFSSPELGDGTFSIVEDSRLSKEDTGAADGENRGTITVYFNQPNALGLKKIQAKFNGKLSYDPENAGQLLLDGKFEIIGGVNPSDEPLRINGKGVFTGTGSGGSFTLEIDGFYKLNE